jgi:hypothetical protein
MTKFGIDCVSPPTAFQARRIATAGYTFCIVYVGGPYATPGNKNGWPNASVGAIAPHFTDGFIPIYVGQQNVPNNPNLAGGIMTYEQGKADGLQADAMTGACGFDSTTPLGLDLEAGNLQADPAGVRAYVSGWVESVNAAGHPAGLYGDIYTIAHLGTPDLIDWTFPASWHWTVPSWLAAFPNPQLGANAADPAQPPPSTLWQFASGGQIAGVDVDLDSVTDTFDLAKYTPPPV